MQLADIVKEASSEWGIKALALTGVWISAPTVGNLALGSLSQVLILLFGSITIVFANKFYDDFIQPRSPAVETDPSPSEAEVQSIEAESPSAGAEGTD